MKKLLVIIIILGALIFLYFSSQKSGEVRPGEVTGEKFQPDPSNATFNFDDSSITLSNGKYEDSESESAEEINILEEKATGDLNADGKEDTVLLLVRNGGGSGVFIYAAAYISGPISYKGSNAVFLGDRISPQSISISNGVATIKYLDREEGEPFAAEPTIPASKQFVYKNGEFVER